MIGTGGSISNSNRTGSQAQWRENRVAGRQMVASNHNNNPKITLFTLPKPFSGHIGIIQRNAIRSWITLGPAVEIILIGDETGMAETASTLGVGHVPVVDRNQYNTPMVNSAFQIAQEVGRGSLMAYVNADIILTPNLLKVIENISLDRFLVSCQRWDLDLDFEFDFESAGWQSRLNESVKSRGRLHEPAGIDCFIFPRGMYQDLPPFAIGRPGWDNWLIYRTRQMQIPVIDATQVMMIVHQNHDYSHHPKIVGTEHGGPERDINLELAGGWDYIFNLEDADWLMGPDGLKKSPLTMKNLPRRLQTLGVLSPFAAPISKLYSFCRYSLKKFKDLMLGR